MQLDIAVMSEVGGRTANEDSCAYWSGPKGYYFVVADGAGGHKGGAVASRLAVNAVLTSLRDSGNCDGSSVENAIAAANRLVVEQQRARERYSEMRTTAVVLAVDAQEAHATWGHIGDSRLYCIRGGQIVAQTRDHSVVQTMVDAGYLKAEQLRSSPDRSKLLSALGDEDHFDPAIEREHFAITSEDRFLLCTDGLWEYVEEKELEQTVAESASAEEWLQSLRQIVLSRAKRKHDNYTAIAVWCRPDGA